MSSPNVSIGLMAAALAAAAPAAQPDPALAFTASDTGDNIFEVSVAGTRLPSREAAEARLLLETAKFTLAQRRDWFRLLTLPGEMIAPRPGPVAAYPAWHSEWCYKLKGEQWQIWRPHWGARFWAGDVDLGRLEAFEASALVELGSGTVANGHDAFDALAVVRDLQSRRDEGSPDDR